MEDEKQVNTSLDKSRKIIEFIKLISLLVITLILFGCASLDKRGAETNYEGHPIIGNWSFNVNGCTETNEFRPDGTRTCTSALEVVQAAYTISTKPFDSGFYKITDRVIKDNGKEDCLGSTEDMTGDVVELHVKFNLQMDQMMFCLDESLDKCFGPFRKNQ